MKKLLLFTILSIFIISVISGQQKNQNEEQKNNFHFGIITGVNIYSFEDLPTLGYSNTNFSESSAIFLGLFSEMNLSNKFTLRSEVQYAFGTNTDFLEIPIILKYKLCDKVFSYAGVQMNYMLKERNKYFRKVGWGYNLGIEYNFAKNWFLDLRYVYRDSQQLLFDDLPSQNSTIRLGVGYRF